MTNTKLRVERRTHKRFRVQNDTFVVLVSSSTRIGSLKDMAMKGLSFHYVGRKEPLTKRAELSIFSPENNFYLFAVLCEIISDSKPYKNHPGPVSMRRCGVQFCELSPYQTSQLEYFIHNYTTGLAYV